MYKTQDIINKANEDFIKYKGRLMYLGKDKLFEQGEKINLAKKVKEMLTQKEMSYDNSIMRTIMEMENIYDTFYMYYKRKYTMPASVELSDLFQDVIWGCISKSKD